MALLASSNPALQDKAFSQYRSFELESDTMTVDGAVNRTILLLALLICSATVIWGMVATDPILARGLMIGGLIVGLISAIIIIFCHSAAPFLSPVYAIAEGLALGAISCMLEKQYPGIAVQALLLTVSVFMVMLMAYKAGLIRATAGFQRGVIAATGAIFLVYLVSWIMRMCGLSIPFIHDAGPVGILFSVAIVTIAALNLVLDFAFIERGAEQGLPKNMEWYAAFGLVVTLVWLYIEILRLLSKLRRR